MSDSNVQSALIEAVADTLALAGVPSENIKWENRKFDPTGKSVWVSVSYNPTTPVVVTLGKTGRDREAGFMQVDIHIPSGEGEEVTAEIYSKFREEMPAGKTFTYGDCKVIITNVGQSQGIEKDSWYLRAITIFYRADLTRNN